VAVGGEGFADIADEKAWKELAEVKDYDSE
jgi:hypothetical protein